MSTQIISTSKGNHTVNGPLTLETSAQAAPQLLRNVIDSRIVRIRPMSTPIDQLSRCGDARNCGSMTVEYYSVDSRPTEIMLAEDVPGGRGKRKSETVYTHTLYTDNDLAFSVSETLMVPGVLVTPDGSKDSVPLVFYVIESSGSGVEVMAVNAPTDGTGAPVIPAIPYTNKIVRMGRAAAELDVQTPQFQPLPHKASNNCQIFKIKNTQQGSNFCLLLPYEFKTQSKQT